MGREAVPVGLVSPPDGSWGKTWAMVAVTHEVDVLRDRASPQDTDWR
jgi:hypothetical protein